MNAQPNIALIGFMTAGKTQVGTALGRRTGMRFADVDHLVSEREQTTIADIFREKGEPYFRQLESQVLQELCRRNGWIISCGGGTVLATSNRDLLRTHCVTVWLRVSEAEVLRRLEDPKAPGRPLLEGSDAGPIVHRLLTQREPLYEQSDYIVDTDGRTIEGVTEEIIDRLGLPLDGL